MYQLSTDGGSLLNFGVVIIALKLKKVDIEIYHWRTAFAQFVSQMSKRKPTSYRIVFYTRTSVLNSLEITSTIMTGSIFSSARTDSLHLN